MASVVVLSTALVAVLLCGTEARIYPDNIQGPFTLTNASDPSLCPKKITHTTYQGTDNKDIWRLPHNTILHDAARCESVAAERSTLFYSNSLIPGGVPPGLNAIMKASGLNQQINFPLVQRATKGGVYYIGYEALGRFCGDNSRFLNGTTYFLFRPFDFVNMPISAFNNSNFRFVPDYKYLIVVPRYSNNACVYETVINGTKTGMMLNSPTPSPSVSPVPAAPKTAKPPAGKPPTASKPVAPVASPTASPSTTPTRTATATAAPTPSPVCFPAHANVELRDGSTKHMSELAIGDVVRTGATSFSPVFMFTHKVSGGAHEFVSIRTTRGRQLLLTRGHYLYVNGHLAAAHVVRTGDSVDTIDGTDTVTTIGAAMHVGLYNPQTVDGDIVVNGVRAATYTTAVEPGAAHALLAPLRAAFRSLRLWTAAAECGADTAAKLVPRGAAVY